MRQYVKTCPHTFALSGHVDRFDFGVMHEQVLQQDGRQFFRLPVRVARTPRDPKHQSILEPGAKQGF